MKVADLIVGQLYQIDPDDRVSAWLTQRGWLQIRREPATSAAYDAEKCEKQVMVYLGRIKSRLVAVPNHPIRETAHSFAMGEKLVYVFGENLRHISPFTEED